MILSSSQLDLLRECAKDDLAFERLRTEFEALPQSQLNTAQRVLDLLPPDEKFGPVFYANPLPMYIANLQSGKLVEVNASFVRLTGVPRERAVGQTMVALGLIADLADLGARATFIYEVKTEGHAREVELHLTDQDGVVHTVLAFGEKLTMQGEDYLLGMYYEVTEYRAAQDALHQAHREFVEMATSIPGMVYRTRRTGVGEYHFDYLSPNCRDINDVEPALLMQDIFHFTTRVHPDDAMPYVQFVEESAHNLTPFRWECRMRVRGEWRWMRFESIPRRAADGTVIWNGIQFDIHEQKQMEDALRASEEKFGKAFHRNPLPMMIADLETGVLVEANESYANLLGIPREEIVGHTTPELGVISGELALGQRAAIYENVHARGRASEIELHLTDRAGVKHIVLAYGEKLTVQGQDFLLGMDFDITEFRATQEALQQAHREFVEMATSIPGMVYRTRQAPDGTFKFEYISPRSQDMMGLAPEAIVADSQTLRNITHPDDGLNSAALAQASARDLKEFRWEARIRVNGEWRWMRMESRPHRLRDGTVIWNGIQTDVHDQKMTAEALRTSEEKFAKAFHSAPFGLTITTAPEGRFIDANEQWCQQNGFVREAILGKTTTELGIVIDPEGRAEMFRQLRATGHLRNYELRIANKAGQMRHLLTSIEMIEVAGQACLLTVSFDITERREAEAALRASEEKFAKAFHSAPFGLTLTTVPDGRFIEVNDQWCQDRGYSREAVIGKTTAELGMVVDETGRVQVLQQLQTTGRVRNAETKTYNRDGQLRHLMTSIEIIEVAGERCALAIHFDITERRAAEAALRASEEKFAKAFHSAPFGLTLSTMPEGRFIEANDHWLEQVGFTHEEVLGKTSVELGMVADTTWREEVVRQLQISGRVRNVEGIVQNRLGQTRNILTSLEIIQVGSKPHALAIHLDITERRQAEAALRHREEQFRAAAEGRPDGFYLLKALRNAEGQIEDFEFEYMNAEAERELGYRREDLVGRRLTEVFPINIRGGFFEQYIQVVETGEVLEQEYRTPTDIEIGRWRHHVVIRVGDGIAITDRNITRRKLAEQAELERTAFEKERELNLLKSKMMQRISHEFRTPLAIITTSGELLRSYYERLPADKREKHWQNIQTQVLRITELLSGISLIIHDELLEMKPLYTEFDLVAVFRDAIEMQSRLAPDSQLALNTPFTNYRLKADFDRIRLMLTHLISNAIKYSPPRAVVAVRLLPNPTGEGIIIQVQDAGIGILPAELPRVSEPFFRGSNFDERPGLGLGMTIVQQVVVIHNGAMQIASTPGHGTTVTVTLPL